MKTKHIKQIDYKIEKVKEILANKKIAISFSGGADSTLLAHIAKEVCEDVLLITYNNCIMPSGFLDFAKEKASELGIKHEIIENDFIDIDEFVENTKNKCYICRNLMYESIKQVAKKQEYKIIVDGTNISDLIEDRPGILVNYKNNIKSPFIEGELESNEIHEYLDVNNINYSRATTCLGTRIKTGEKITSNKINRISYCEDIIKNIVKSDEIRLREENNTGTIEIRDVENIIDKEKIKQIKYELKNMNYDKLLLNIGFEDKEKDIVNYIQNPITNKIIFEKELPYPINLELTYKNLKSENNNRNIIKKIRYIDNIGMISIDLENKKKITIFKTNTITGKNFNSKEDAKKAMIKILKRIRREDIK